MFCSFLRNQNNIPNLRGFEKGIYQQGKSILKAFKNFMVKELVENGVADFT